MQKSFLPQRNLFVLEQSASNFDRYIKNALNLLLKRYQTISDRMVRYPVDWTAKPDLMTLHTMYDTHSISTSALSFLSRVHR